MTTPPRTPFQRGQLQQGLAMRLALERARQAQPVTVRSVTSRVSPHAATAHTVLHPTQLVAAARQTPDTGDAQ